VAWLGSSESLSGGLVTRNESPHQPPERHPALRAGERAAVDIQTGLSKLLSVKKNESERILIERRKNYDAKEARRFAGKPRLSTPVISEEEKARFWKTIHVGNIEDCWPAKNKPTSKGYCNSRFHRVKYRTHRLACMIHYGNVPVELLCCHHCDNRSCCNPHHIFFGTHKDNGADAVKKNRYPSRKGSLNDFAKLNEEKVLVIRRMRRERGTKYSSLAKKFKVSKSCIYQVLTWKKWTHVDEITHELT
jgi:hypothetical protein